MNIALTRTGSFAAALTLAVALLATPQAGAGETSRAYLHGYNLPSSGVALEGYCPVAYFAVNQAVKGSPEFASTHNGVTYYFVSEEARQAFDAEPEKFLPAYGGWCALGIALGDKFPVDPTRFKIVDGRLLLFLRNASIDTLSMWDDGNEQEQLNNADTNWTKMQQ